MQKLSLHLQNKYTHVCTYQLPIQFYIASYTHQVFACIYVCMHMHVTNLQYYSLESLILGYIGITFWYFSSA